MTVTIIDANEDDAKHHHYPGSVELQINSIIHGGRWQFRALIPAKVSEYAMVLKNEGELPPVRVARLNGATVLIDGNHRLEAALKQGRTTIRASIEDVETETRIMWLASEANMDCGIPLDASDYRRALGNYVKDKQFRGKGGSFKSFADIARDLGGTRSRWTIRRWLMADYPKLAEKLAKHDADEKPMTKREKDVKEADAGMAATMADALSQAAAAAPGVTSRANQRKVIEQLDRLRRAIKDAGWEKGPTSIWF